MTAPTAVPPQFAPPAPRRGGGWFAAVFAFIITLVTGSAIGLGAIAPQFVENAASDLPSGWTVVVDADLANAPSDWQVGPDCSFDRGGLFASSGSSPCVYTPSARVDYLSQGFRLDMTLAPAASTEKSQVAEVLAGTAFFGIAQDGSFALADDSHYSATQAQDFAFNWHANGLAANTIRLQWDGPQTPLVAYTNGYKAAEIPFSMNASSNHALQVGAGRDAQALYTHITLASASAQG
jgi:hypothetical protein